MFRGEDPINLCLELKSVKSKTHEATRLEVLRVLDSYGLKEKFMNGKISLSVDGALFRMFSGWSDFDGIENRCGTHVGRKSQNMYA